MSLNRVVAATVVAAAVIGVPGSALAISSAGDGAKSATAPATTAPTSAPGAKSATAPATTAPTSAPGAKSRIARAGTAGAPKASASSDLSALAASAGITESQLESGLGAAKQAGGNNPSAVAGFARATGVSPA